MHINIMGTGVGERVLLLVDWRLELPQRENAEVHQDSTHFLQSPEDKLEMPVEWEEWANCRVLPI